MQRNPSLLSSGLPAWQSGSAAKIINWNPPTPKSAVTPKDEVLRKVKVRPEPLEIWFLKDKGRLSFPFPPIKQAVPRSHLIDLQRYMLSASNPSYSSS